MKKFMFIMVCIMATFLFTACGTSETKTEKEPEVIEEKKTEVSLRDLAPDGNEMYPDYEFQVFDKDGGTCYTFIINSATPEMFEEYKESAKTYNFSYVTFDSEQWFKAYTEDEQYSIDVYWYAGDDDYDSYMLVSVKVVEPVIEEEVEVE